jgi:hypothetical protein
MWRINMVVTRYYTLWCSGVACAVRSCSSSVSVSCYVVVRNCWLYGSIVAATLLCDGDMSLDQVQIEISESCARNGLAIGWLCIVGHSDTQEYSVYMRYACLSAISIRHVADRNGG